jgi:uncharacterized protein
VPPLRFLDYEVDEHILDKIMIKHGVSFDELDEAFYNSSRQVRRGRHGVYLLFSRTEAGRFLILVIADRGEGSWQIASARDMTLAERRTFQ